MLRYSFAESCEYFSVDVQSLCCIFRSRDYFSYLAYTVLLKSNIVNTLLLIVSMVLFWGIGRLCVFNNVLKFL